ncbi:hypothetical protein DTL42_11705 [Bremerella cremea]|uniref:Double-GTPase 2 domain-containing protein n=2 Tax=Bremerella cremea TaxID=1031537 RepID=A0A368KQN9_9BACT|nr:hypothetical protein DTL42_11705 [Bremerella cremea]
MFPRHTPNTEDRVPGLLHLAFRNSRNRLEDYLFTDAPGEWFSNWSTNRSAENAKGARWIAKFSDSILFFIDCEELAGENVGTTRNSITQLAQRLADEVEDKRVLIIWSKHDIQLDPIIHEQISTRLADYLPAAKHFNISVYEDDHLGIQTVAKELLGRLDFQGTRITIKVPIRADNPFFTFRSV